MIDTSMSNSEILRRIQESLCTAEELKALAGSDIETDRLIASSANADKDTLYNISQSRDNLTRINLANNPTIPIEALINLADYLPREILQNPAFALWISNDLGVLKCLAESTIAQMLSQKDCPLSIIEWAHTFHNKKNSFSLIIMQGIVKNPCAPMKIIKSILEANIPVEITCSEGPL